MDETDIQQCSSSRLHNKGDKYSNVGLTASKTHFFSRCPLPTGNCHLLNMKCVPSLLPPLLRSQEGRTSSNTTLPAIRQGTCFKSSLQTFSSHVVSRVLITEQYIRLAEPKFQAGRDQQRGQTCPITFSQKEKVKGSVTEENTLSAPESGGPLPGMERSRGRVPLGCGSRCSTQFPYIYLLLPHSPTPRPTHAPWVLAAGQSSCTWGILGQTLLLKPKINSHCSHKRTVYLKLK